MEPRNAISVVKTRVQHIVILARTTDGVLEKRERERRAYPEIRSVRAQFPAQLFLNNTPGREKKRNDDRTLKARD